MDIREAIQIISKEAPCRHDSYEAVGAGIEGKCADCGEYFKITRKQRYDKAADEFDAAIDFLIELDNSINPKPRTEKVEIKQWGVFIGTESPSKLSSWSNELDAIASANRVEGSFVVEMSGYYERVLPPKTKRREEITLNVDAEWRCVNIDSEIPGNTSCGHFFFEWEE